MGNEAGDHFVVQADRRLGPFDATDEDPFETMDPAGDSVFDAEEAEQ